MYKLDAKGKKLLGELDRNSRQSIQQLAKRIGLSKDATKYRIKKLLDEGVIKSFNAVIDTGKLGFHSFRLFLKFYNLSPEKEQELLDALLANEHLVWLVQAEGNWDLNTWFLYKNIEEMDRFVNAFLERYGNYIEKREFGIYSSVTYYSRSYLQGEKKNTFSMPIISLPQEQPLNEAEEMIIQLLSKNARCPIVELAAKSGLTPKTVIAKIKKLEAEKIIVGYRTEFDLEKLGYKYYKIHISTFNITPEKRKMLKQFLKEHPNIIYEDIVLGGYDIEFEVQTRNEEETRKLMNEVKRNFSSIIKSYEILHYYKEHRLRFYPFIAATP